MYVGSIRVNPYGLFLCWVKYSEKPLVSKPNHTYIKLSHAHNP